MGVGETTGGVSTGVCLGTGVFYPCLSMGDGVIFFRQKRGIKINTRTRNIIHRSTENWVFCCILAG